jgi:hypothetical protein
LINPISEYHRLPGQNLDPKQHLSQFLLFCGWDVGMESKGYHMPLELAKLAMRGAVDLKWKGPEVTVCCSKGTGLQNWSSLVKPRHFGHFPRTCPWNHR